MYEQLTRRVPQGESWVRRIGREVTRSAGPQHARRQAELAERLQRPVTTGRKIAVASVRGGAGKSTVTALVGSALAVHRGDRVVAVDGDPDLGSLAARLGVEQGPSIRALFGGGAQPAAFDRLGQYLRQTPGRLWVMSGRRELSAPPVDVPSFGHAQLAFSRYFAASLVDCGAGLYGELTRAVLSRVHALVLVVPTTADGVRSSREALDLLARTSYRPLLDRCVVALVSHSRGEGTDLAAAVRILSVHGVRVVRLPYDRHLAAGAVVDAGKLSQGVLDGTLETAAEALLRATWS